MKISEVRKIQFESETVLKLVEEIKRLREKLRETLLESMEDCNGDPIYCNFCEGKCKVYKDYKELELQGET